MASYDINLVVYAPLMRYTLSMTMHEARDKPTTEWEKHHKGHSIHTTMIRGTGREVETVWQLRYTSRYAVIHEEDILRGDYTACLGTLYAAHRSFRLASKGEIARGEGPRGEDPSELERIYSHPTKSLKPSRRTIPDTRV